MQAGIAPADVLDSMGVLEVLSSTELDDSDSDCVDSCASSEVAPALREEQPEGATPEAPAVPEARTLLDFFGAVRAQPRPYAHEMAPIAKRSRLAGRGDAPPCDPAPRAARAAAAPGEASKALAAQKPVTRRPRPRRPTVGPAQRGADLEDLEPAAGDKGRRKTRGRALTPVPSLAFAGPERCESAEDEGAEGGAGEVEAFMTVARRASKAGSHTQRVAIEEVERMMPVTFIRGVLPPAFADHLLRVFAEEAKRWKTSKRWLYDREIESHRVESGFRFDNFGQQRARGFGQRWETAGFGDDLRHLRACVADAVRLARAELRRSWQSAQAGRPGPEPAARSSHQVAQETLALASRGQKLNADSVDWLIRYAVLSADKGWRWEPNYCVANFYKDEDDFLGAHSDPVESIGPFAIVASLTFGAARQFRMKPVGTITSPTSPSERVTSFSIRLPHNSVLICWEGFQEFWRHEVPKDRGLRRHPICGPARLNFTFRKTMVAVAHRRPLCGCGRKARLKPVLKETSRNRGRYFWSCNNPRVGKGQYQSCPFFQWDDELLAKQSQAAAPATRCQA